MNDLRFGYPLVWFAVALPPMVGAYSLLSGRTLSLTLITGKFVAFLFLRALGHMSPLLGWRMARYWLARGLGRRAPDTWILTGCEPHWAFTFAAYAGVGNALFALFALVITAFAWRSNAGPLNLLVIVLTDVWWLARFVQHSIRVAVLKQADSGKPEFVLHDLDVPKRVSVHIRESGPRSGVVRTREQWGPDIDWKPVGPIDALIAAVRAEGKPQGDPPA